jgi:hypothetical protein
MFKSCFALVVAMLMVLKLSHAQYGNTLNKCFYKSGLHPAGTPITSIHITENSIDAYLASCCNFCRALPTCIVWQFYESSQECGFYKTVSGFVSDTDFYAGKNSESNFWNCNEVKDTWYFDASIWTKQTPGSSSTQSRSNCCHDCFWKPTETNLIGGCLSWMYNEASRDCYHSTKDYSSYPSNIYFVGMYTGKVLISF